VADYPVATLTGSGEPEVAAAFVEFLLSDDGQAILESWGFDPA
jgi:molybdate transport system substrate-binding protein